MYQIRARFRRIRPGLVLDLCAEPFDNDPRRVNHGAPLLPVPSGLIGQMSTSSEKDVHASVTEARDDDAIIAAAGPDEKTRASIAKGLRGPPPFKISDLWSVRVSALRADRPRQTPPINPVNLKSYTMCVWPLRAADRPSPLFNLKSAYARNFHLSWLGCAFSHCAPLTAQSSSPSSHGSLSRH